MTRRATDKAIARHQELIALGRAIRHLRTQRNISARDLASAAGLTTRRLDRIEAGQRDPAFDVLLALADALGIKPTELMDRAGRERARRSTEGEGA